MNQLFDPDELPELDDLLEPAGDEKMSPKQLRQWNSNVHSRLDDDLDALLEEAARPRPQWEVEAAVVLIQEQTCISCGTTSQYCQGWFASQKHTTDKFARRMVAGRPIGNFPLRVERHKLPEVEICASCAESQISIETILKGGK